MSSSGLEASVLDGASFEPLVEAGASVEDIGAWYEERRGFEACCSCFRNCEVSADNQRCQVDKSGSCTRSKYFQRYHQVSTRSHICSSTIMAAFSRGLRSFVFRNEYMRCQCLGFSSTATTRSGHNRWSKIKHDKGTADAKKNRERSVLAAKITLASKRMIQP